MNDDDYFSVSSHRFNFPGHDYDRDDDDDDDACDDCFYCHFAHFPHPLDGFHGDYDYDGADDVKNGDGVANDRDGNPACNDVAN